MLMCYSHPLVLISIANRRVYLKYSRRTSFYINNIKPPSNNSDSTLVIKSNRNNQLTKNTTIKQCNKNNKLILCKRNNRINQLQNNCKTYLVSHTNHITVCLRSEYVLKQALIILITIQIFIASENKQENHNKK